MSLVPILPDTLIMAEVYVHAIIFRSWGIKRTPPLSRGAAGRGLGQPGSSVPSSILMRVYITVSSEMRVYDAMRLLWSDGGPAALSPARRSLAR